MVENKPMMLALACVLLLAAPTAARTKDFPPGWNGKARTPPM